MFICGFLKKKFDVFQEQLRRIVEEYLTWRLSLRLETFKLKLLICFLLRVLDVILCGKNKTFRLKLFILNAYLPYSDLIGY